MQSNTQLDKLTNKIKNYIKLEQDPSNVVVDFKTPSELRNIIDFTVGENSISESEFMGLIDDYLKYSVKTGDKQFLNQLFSGFNFPAFIGEICTSLTNTSMYTYEVAPVATLIEMEMIKLMNLYTGYSEGDGIFVTGGSNANMLAMFSARNQRLPETRQNGYDCSHQLTAFINEHAHYSFETATNLLGIGAGNVIKVKTDDNGMLIPESLEKEIVESIERSEKPFFVAATCATTILGAYDPLDAMSAICKKYDLWLHADGSFGGSLLLSKQHRGLMDGIEKTDSFTWNPHKLMNIPLVCSVLLVKKKGLLESNLTDTNTDYIFHEQQDLDMVEDLGKKSIQCGRRVDAVKLWFAWKYFGQKGYQNRIDNLMAVAQYSESKVIENSHLELLAPRQSFSICFRYVPKFKVDLNKFNLAVRDRLRKSGQSFVNYGYINQQLAIRLVIANAELKCEDIDLLFNNLCTLAEELEKNWH